MNEKTIKLKYVLTNNFNIFKFIIYLSILATIFKPLNENYYLFTENNKIVFYALIFFAFFSDSIFEFFLKKNYKKNKIIIIKSNNNTAYKILDSIIMLLIFVLPITFSDLLLNSKIIYILYAVFYIPYQIFNMYIYFNSIKIEKVYN